MAFALTLPATTGAYFLLSAGLSSLPRPLCHELGDLGVALTVAGFVLWLFGGPLLVFGGSSLAAMRAREWWEARGLQPAIHRPTGF